MIRKVGMNDLIHNEMYVEIFNQMIDLMDAMADTVEGTTAFIGTPMLPWARQYKEKRK